MRVIGRVSTDVRHVDAAPSQASEGRTATGGVVLDRDLADGLLGLEAYRWLWLLTWLHDQPAEPAPLQLVPRATEHSGKVQGVFASRAPARPNPLGLSLVEQVGIEGTNQLPRRRPGGRHAGAGRQAVVRRLRPPGAGVTAACRPVRCSWG